MDDLISRKAAIETVKKLLYETALNSYGSYQDVYADIAENRIGIWMGIVPSAPAVPVVHGKWVEHTGALGEISLFCSECGETGPNWESMYGDLITEEYPYCPNCGAKMDGGDADEHG